MHIIHLFWQQTNNQFDNTGRLLLWIESEFPVNKKGYYPYQLNETDLSQWYQENLSPTVSVITTKVNLPCNEAGDAIPSPIIANLNDLSDIKHHKMATYSLKAIAVDNPLKIIKALQFIQFYLEDNFKLGDDALFWIKLAKELGTIIKKDQFIPVLVAKKQNKKITYFSKWQPCSSNFELRLEKIANFMPYSACLGQFSAFNQAAALKHFSEVSLTHLIASTCYTKKLLKCFGDTFLEQSLNLDSFTLPESVWKEWKMWANNLSYDQFGAPFQLCFKLNSATNEKGDNWTLVILIQSKIEPSFMISLDEYWREKKKNSKLFSKMFGSSIERTLLLQLGYASRIYALLESVFESNMQRKYLGLSTDEAFAFLKEDAWALHACGYRIIVPSWWTSQGRLKAKIKMRGTKSHRSGDSDTPSGYFAAKSLVNFDYQYAMGEHEISQAEWNQLIESKSELVYFRGQWIEIDVEEMKKMQKLIESSQKDKESGSIKDLLMMAADDKLYEVDFDEALAGMLSKLQDKDKIDLEVQPENLAATLRPYQVRGLSWLSYLEDLGMSPCLADDMGLGKTMQVIALLLAKPKEKAALLVAPTSVVGNWLREITKFAPSIKVAMHHGSKRKQDKAFETLIEKNEVIITSYGLIRRDKALFNQYHWSRLIIDEAQNIKNPAAAQTKTLMKIPSDSRIALTGTPVENRLLDLWSIFTFLNPGFLGTRSAFKNAFEFPIQRDNCPYKTRVLKNLVEPFILRRLKTDKNIIHDLPDKIEQKVYCELTREQASIYQSIVDEIEKDLQEADKEKRSSLILSSLLRLKQCCNHPAQVLQDNSDFTAERSIKLRRLIEMAKEIIDNGESLLIFSQFKDICDSLNKLLKTELGYTTYYLHGGTSRKKREEMIESFQAEESPPGIFILSLKAGGVGITLTKANHVIHFDRWWNPAVENQATDRAYRIGQQKTVFAHKFITMGTIEERIDAMLEEKQQVADTIVGNDESWLSKLDTKSFIDLIKLSKEAIALDD